MNRLLGTLFALATLAAIVFAILNIGNYTSMHSVSDVEEEMLTIDEETAYEEIMPIDSLSNEIAPERME